MSNIEKLQDSIIDELVAKYEDEPCHCRQVMKLALNIFDELTTIVHNYGIKERKLLKYACLLHDIGYHISWENHNKHAYNMIMDFSMPHFLPEEIEIIANIARYHRGKLPKEKHKNFARIKNRETKKLIKHLSSFIRIADGLDRSHSDAITKVKILKDDYTGKITFFIHTNHHSCPGELYAANKKKDLFEQEFNLGIDFIIQHN